MNVCVCVGGGGPYLQHGAQPLQVELLTALQLCSSYASPLQGRVTHPSQVRTLAHCSLAHCSLGR